MPKLDLGSTSSIGTRWLSRHWNTDAPDNLAVEWAPRSSKNKWVTWAAAGLALTGGALAVNFKFKADDEYERYLESGDPCREGTG